MSATGNATSSSPSQPVLPYFSLKGKGVNFVDETAKKIAILSPVSGQEGLNRLLLKRNEHKNSAYPILGPTFPSKDINAIVVRDYKPMPELMPDLTFDGTVEIVLFPKQEEEEKQQNKCIVMRVDVWGDLICAKPKNNPAAQEIRYYQFMGEPEFRDCRSSKEPIERDAKTDPNLQMQ